MKRLPPLRFDKVWGYELWLASTHPHGFQQELKDVFGSDFPLLVKIIQADSRLSVQVHPDDERAQLYEHCRGKTECWYVLHAESDAQIVYGLNGVYTDRELRTAIEANSLEDCLRFVPVQTGDFIYIPAGTVHAIGGGMRLLEVQQSSDVTYRLYDWGRDRELHVEKGIACIKHDRVRDVSSFTGAFSCPYFTLRQISAEEHETLTLQKFCLLFITDGEGCVNGETCHAEELVVFQKGETLTLTGSLRGMLIS